MNFCDDLKQRVDQLTLLVDQKAVSAAQLRAWMRLLTGGTIPSPEDSIDDPEAEEDLAQCREEYEFEFVMFIGQLPITHLGLGPHEELSQELQSAQERLCESLSDFTEAASRRQPDEDGWLHACVYFMRTCAEGYITPESMDIFLATSRPFEKPARIQA